MKRHLFWVGILMIVMAASGCSFKKSYMMDQQPNLKPSEGKAIVHFIRPSGYGKGAKATLWDGDKLIGVSFGEQAFQYECEPGKHLFIGWSEFKSPVEADLLPNRVYYVLLRIRMGWWRGRLHLVPVNKDHPLWKETLAWSTSVPNYAFDMQHLAVAENESKQKIMEYLSHYENEVKGTKYVSYLRPEDGIVRD